MKRRVAMISRGGMSKAMAAVPARLTLRTPDGQTVVAVGKGSPVTVTGEPRELLLFASAATQSASTSAGTTSRRRGPGRQARLLSPCLAFPRPGETVSRNGPSPCKTSSLAVAGAVPVRLEYGYKSPQVAGVTPG